MKLRYTVLVLLAATPWLSAADPAIGEGIYRSNCGFCHGTKGEGGRGSRLNQPLTHGSTVAAVKKIVTNGIPGTQMAAFRFKDDELTSLANYVLTLGRGTTAAVKLVGDPVAGQKIYTRNGCGSCHRIGEKGGDFGPDLTRVGGARSVEYLKASILQPGADVPEDWRGVLVKQKDGSQVSGLRVNEDTFTVQLRGIDMRFRSFEKDAVASVTELQGSMMPAYLKFSESELNDLLGYLQTLKATSDAKGEAMKAKGIH